MFDKVLTRINYHLVAPLMYNTPQQTQVRRAHNSRAILMLNSRQTASVFLREAARRYFATPCNGFCTWGGGGHVALVTTEVCSLLPAYKSLPSEAV